MKTIKSHLLLKILSLLIFLLLPSSIHSQLVIIYTVDRDDYNLENIKSEILTQEEAETEYRTIVLVYDSHREEIIGGWGSYKTKCPTKEDFRQIIDNAVMDLYNGIWRIRCTEINPKNKGFDGILGLRWGMPMTDALAHLHSMSFTNVKQLDETHLTILDDVFWNGRRFDFFRLGYMVSNKQNKYLCDLVFARLCNNAQEAKQIRDSIAQAFIIEFGSENVEEEIDENGFKKYTVFQETKSEIKISRINLYIGKADGVYATCLYYYGWFEASQVIENDNNINNL